MAWPGDVVHRFAVADRLLRHWQAIGGVGRPEEWHPLEYSDANVPVMRARIEVAVSHSTFAGTEQSFELRKLSEDLRCIHFPEPGPEKNIDDHPSVDIVLDEVPGRVGPGEDEPPPEE